MVMDFSAYSGNQPSITSPQKLEPATDTTGVRVRSESDQSSSLVEKMLQESLNGANKQDNDSTSSENSFLG